MEAVSRATGHLVVDWRKDRGMSQQHLAGMLGTSPQYLCELEKGKRRPSKTLAILIQYVTGVNGWETSK
jgi:transcriptional regulator with XRE-family HTH domain